MSPSLLLFMTLISVLAASNGLRIRRLSVAKAVENGSSLFLSCLFDLEGETLYSVKWYRDYVEFFRFLPSNTPTPAQTIRLKGAFVDASRSNSSHVFLYKTDLDSEGTYACEVSTESPTYSTVRSEQAMKIFVLPKERVYIEGFTEDGQSRIKTGSSQIGINARGIDIGDILNLTCVSGASRPPPKMAWFINGEMALPDQVTAFPTQTLINGLQARKLGLTIRVTQDLFKKGILKLRCSATLLITYQFEASRTITPGSSSASDGHHHDFSPNEGHSVVRAREAPVITGSSTGSSGKGRYKIGDWVHLNCSTHADDVHLKWYINGNDAGPLQTKEYLSLSSGPVTGWTLGLRLFIEKQHLQMPEIKFKCVAIYHDIIREYSTQVNVVSKAFDLMSSMTSTAMKTTSAIHLVVALILILFSS